MKLESSLSPSLSLPSRIRIGSLRERELGRGQREWDFTNPLLEMSVTLVLLLAFHILQRTQSLSAHPIKYNSSWRRISYSGNSHFQVWPLDQTQEAIYISVVSCTSSLANKSGPTNIYHNELLQMTRSINYYLPHNKTSAYDGEFCVRNWMGSPNSLTFKARPI